MDLDGFEVQLEVHKETGDAETKKDERRKKRKVVEWSKSPKERRKEGKKEGRGVQA
jgi:hypothetical protein